MNRLGKNLTALAITAVVMAMAAPAMAIPTLQVYIEGASYEAESETWLTSNGDFTLWVVGSFNVGESILDVRLSAAYAHGDMGTIVFTPTAANNATFGTTDTNEGFVPSLQYVADGTAPVDLDGDGDIDVTPVQSDGTNLPNHGAFGSGTDWKQWQLGDMLNATETYIADFQAPFAPGDPMSSHQGQILAYNVSVSGFSAGITFDAFNHVEPARMSGSVFAPFSHNAGVIPEPTSMTLLGLGLTGWAIAFRRRRKDR